MGMEPTGNGRRESYAHIPMPRMTNTFMLAGNDDPEQILRSVQSGIYAVSFGGGQVDITSGKFVFSVSEAYEIEDGRIGAPLKGATLIGNGPDVLTRVSRIGGDLELDRGIRNPEVDIGIEPPRLISPPIAGCCGIRGQIGDAWLRRLLGKSGPSYGDLTLRSCCFGLGARRPRTRGEQCKSQRRQGENAKPPVAVVHADPPPTKKSSGSGHFGFPLRGSIHTSPDWCDRAL